MGAHTPGPFTVGQLCNVTIRIDEPERCAGMVFVEPAALGRPYGLSRAEATARLWAAAPDLLAALRLMLSDHRTGGCPERTCEVCRKSEAAKDYARVAIARAEGR